MSAMVQTKTLHAIAHGRSGDKGNRLNVNVIAYDERHWPVLRDQITAERVAALFAHRGVTAVQRYELPQLHALNFVIEDALEGGVNSSLAIDTHGKCLSYLVLGMDVQVQDDLAAGKSPGAEVQMVPKGQGGK